MNNIIEFFKKKYRLLIPIMVVIVLLITVFFLYREYKFDNTRNKSDEDVFQCYGGVKLEYTATFTYNLKKSIVDVVPKDRDIEINNIPIYYSDMSGVVFPTVMSIVFPLRNAGQYKLYKYASYFAEEDVHFIKNNEDTDNYENFFLYDGKNVFFFPYESVLKINGEDYAELGPMSYVNLVGGYTLLYYDAATDTTKAIEIDGDTVSVVWKNIEVNVSEKYFKSFNSQYLLHNPNNLNPVFKTIDK